MTHRSVVSGLNKNIPLKVARAWQWVTKQAMFERPAENLTEHLEDDKKVGVLESKNTEWQMMAKDFCTVLAGCSMKTQCKTHTNSSGQCQCEKDLW